jgi:quercetin dioxygenase-like cupin family protein
MRPVTLADRCRFRPGKFLPELVYGSDRLRVFLLCLEAGQGLAARADSEEMVCCCLEGKAKLTLGDDRVSLSAGEIAGAEAGAVRGIEAQERCLLLWMQVTTVPPYPCPSGIPSPPVEASASGGEGNQG